MAMMSKPSLMIAAPSMWDITVLKMEADRDQHATIGGYPHT